MAKLYNQIMKLSAKDLIKLLLSKEDITQKRLAELVVEKTGKKYTADGLSRKLNRGTITFNEMVLLLDILDYEIKAEHK